jgi:phospholipid/cholesterol/gamma-HCH transport system substrate-binding protein
MKLPSTLRGYVAAAVVAAMGLGGTALVAQHTLGDDDAPDGFTVYADLTDAGALIQGNTVRLHGVNVGKVASIKVVNGHARLTLRLTDTARPIHKDATVQVRPVSLLGERYVDLTDGSPKAPVIPDQGHLPLAQTGRSVDLDEVLSAVDQPTGQALSALVTSLGEGVNGQGGNARSALKALAPALTDTNSLVDVLNQQNDVLTRLIDHTSPVVGALATDRGASVDALVGTSQKLLSATARQEKALRATLRELPGTLRQARQTLAALSGVADQTTPVLADIRPVTDNLNQISGELTKFGAAADPALAGLTPVLHKAQMLIDQAQPLVTELQTASPFLSKDAKNATQFLSVFRLHLRGLLDFVRNWSLTTNGKDGLSHYFRAVVTVQTEEATSLPPGLPASNASGLPLEGLGHPKLPKLGQGLTGLSPAPSATGLTTSQEGSLMGYLMGGSQ